MNELKPCPFCGSYYRRVCNVPTYYKPNPHIYYVKCWDCEAQGARHFTEAEAIESWNTRYERICHSIDETDATQFFICSNCNFGADDIELIPNYCPKCGAKVVRDGS